MTLLLMRNDSSIK